MEQEYFDAIRTRFCRQDGVALGHMMRSEALIYRGKVFAFLSQTNKMVFKLGKTYDLDETDIEMQVFNPFKKRPPLNGWFEVAYSDQLHWEALTVQALETLKSEFHSS